MTIRKTSTLPFLSCCLLFPPSRFAWFEQFQTAPAGSPLAEKGVSFLGLSSFFAAAANGTLPMVSYIIGQEELSEHPPWAPVDGGYLQAIISNAIVNSPKYNATVLMISYDETGGWADQYGIIRFFSSFPDTCTVCFPLHPPLTPLGSGCQRLVIFSFSVGTK